MKGGMTHEQSVALIRAAVLLGRHDAVLSDFERDLVEACVLRLRDQGERATITANEWTVIEEAVAGMAAAREDVERAAQAKAVA